jgi:hypothetical protein
LAVTEEFLMLARAALSVLTLIYAIDPALAESVNCATSVAGAQRLRCSEKLGSPAPKPAAGATTNAPETRLIALAEEILRKQLRKPESAKFTMISVKTAADGSTGVCGMIDSQNDTDGRTGPKPFVYDGQDIYFLIASDGADNGTIHDGPFLDRIFERAKEAHGKFCR